MDWIEVEARIRGGENDATEFKERLRNDDARKALCAFANTTGGLLVVGVADDGRIVGESGAPEATQERLTQLLHSGLSTPVTGTIGRADVGGASVHWVHVAQLRGSQPARVDGRVYVRRGRASVEPSETELAELYNTFGFVLTEERSLAGTSSSDVDVGRFRDHLRLIGLDVDGEPQLPVDTDLRNRGVLDASGASAVTLYGMLAFGYAPQGHRHTANFYVDCCAYAGNDRGADVLLAGEAKGRLDDQVDRAVGWLAALGRRERYEGVERIETPLVPDVAVREALVNAVIHRDYAITGSRVRLDCFDDRLEVWSPGSLPNHLAPEAVRAGGHTRSRNEMMANFMLSRRRMEGRGRGWPVMRRAMRAHNGTEPELYEDRVARWVRVTFRTAK